MQGPDENALRSVIEALHEGIALIDTRDEGWTVRWFNPSFAALTAHRAGAIGGDSARTLLERLGGDSAIAALRDAIAAATEIEWCIEVLDGPRLTVRYIPLTEHDGTRGRNGWLMLRYDDADEAASRERDARRELAVTRRRLKALSDDPATGLAGEQRFRECLRRELSIAARQRSVLSVIVLRMDAFDTYRATFGEHATDSCLRMLARTVSRRLRRGSDLAGRAGEDCLAMLMHDVVPEETAAFADRIAADVGRTAYSPSTFGHREIRNGQSVVARAMVPESDTDADVWLDELLDDLERGAAPALLNRA